MDREGRIAALNVSAGGVPKRAVARARLGPLGLEGDAQRHTKIHGGPERALCLYSLEAIERLRAEGHPVAPGALGENVTLEGVDLAALGPGSRLALGESAVVAITKPAKPCKQIAHCFVEGRFARIAPDDHPGEARLYARVLVVGELAVGDRVRVLP